MSGNDVNLNSWIERGQEGVRKYYFKNTQTNNEAITNPFSSAFKSAPRIYSSEGDQNLAPKIEITETSLKSELNGNENLASAKAEIKLLNLEIEKLDAQINEQITAYRKANQTEAQDISGQIKELESQKATLQQTLDAYKEITGSEKTQYDKVTEREEKLDTLLARINTNKYPGMHGVANAIVDYKKGVYGTQSTKAKSDITSDVLHEETSTLTQEKLVEARKVIEENDDAAQKTQFNDKVDEVNRKIEEQKNQQSLIIKLLAEGEDAITKDNIGEIITALEANKAGFEIQNGDKKATIPGSKINELLDAMKARQKAGVSMISKVNDPADAIRNAKYDEKILQALLQMSDADIIKLCQQDRGTGGQERVNFEYKAENISGKDRWQGLIGRLENWSNAHKSIAYLCARLAKIKKQQDKKLSSEQESAANLLNDDNSVKSETELEKFGSSFYSWYGGAKFSTYYLEICKQIGITVPGKGNNKDRTNEIKIVEVLKGNVDFKSCTPILPDKCNVEKFPES